MYYDMPDIVPNTLFQLILLTTLDLVFISPFKDERTDYLKKKLSLKQQGKKAFHLTNENVNL